MIVTVHPSVIKGTLQAPASKSSMQRACAAALLRKGKTIIYNPGISNDDKAAMDIIRQLGCTCLMIMDVLEIDSTNAFIHQPFDKAHSPIEINCGESGLSVRMFTPIAALCNREIAILGSGSLLQRPVDFFDKVFPQLGIKIESNNGKLPIKIRGVLTPKDIIVDGSLSSQFLTGLLMAYAVTPNPSSQSPADKGGEFGNRAVTITVNNLKSKPYIDLTLEVMKSFGINVPGNNNYESFCFNSSPINQITNQPINYTVESDWSSASFLLVAGAIAGAITVKGLDVFSTQADRAILQALMDCGCSMSVQESRIDISTIALKPFHFNATDCPDLFPPLVALAAYCKGTSAIEGVSRLKHKESNRAVSLQEEFGKMGIEIILQDDLMLVKGGGVVNGVTVHSHHDHRIAMACAVAALKANGVMTIADADAINKSYPNFYDDLKKIGAVIE